LRLPSAPIAARSGFIGSSTDITDRKNHENQLHLSQLELTPHNREMRLINELNSYLQVCRSLGETHAIVAQYARKIFAGYSGVLYLFDEGHSSVEPVARWGGTEIFSSTVICPDDCWGAAAGEGAPGRTDWRTRSSATMSPHSASRDTSVPR